MEPAKLLIHLPSRERPDALVKACRLYAKLCADPVNTLILVSLDNDDHSLDEQQRWALEQLPVQVIMIRGERTSKIGAVNRDLPWFDGSADPSTPLWDGAPDPWPWDILMIASDDQWPVEHGYDDVIRRDMALHFPQGDGTLWYSDGRQDRICTQCIMDRTYYERFGHVYDPMFHSYYADDHYTDRARMLGRMKQLDTCIVRHEHPCFRGAVPDDGLYAHNRQYKFSDRAKYQGWVAAGRP